MDTKFQDLTSNNKLFLWLKNIKIKKLKKYINHEKSRNKLCSCRESFYKECLYAQVYGYLFKDLKDEQLEKHELLNLAQKVETLDTFLFFKMYFYLFECVKQRGNEKGRQFLSTGSPLHGCNNWGGPRQRQECRIPSRAPTWVAKTKVLELSSAATQSKH